MLCNSSRPESSTRSGDGVGCVHHSVDARLLRHPLRPALGPGVDDVGAQPAAVPQAVDVAAGDDLHETAGRDVPDLDEARVEEQDVGRVDGDLLGGAFPFDGAQRATGFAVLVHVKPEF